MTRTGGSVEVSLLDTIRRGDHNGVDAKTVTNSLVAEGYAAPAARRAIQTALDGGVVRLGPGLRLYEGEPAPEVGSAAAA